MEEQNWFDKNLKILLSLFVFFSGGVTILVAKGTGAEARDVLDGPTTALSIQSSGKKVYGGEFSRNFIYRLNADDTVDDTFGKDNTVGFFNRPVYSLKTLSDDSLIVGGAFTNYDQQIVGYLVKLDKDGKLDTNFTRQMGTGFDDQVNDIEIQPDGKIIVAGSFTSFNGYKAPGIVRLNATGGLDPTFDVGSGFNGRVNSVHITWNGDIVVGGTFSQYNGSNRNYFARLSSNGKLIW